MEVSEVKVIQNKSLSMEGNHEEEQKLWLNQSNVLPKKSLFNRGRVFIKEKKSNP
jgi:hypothetical protein